MKTANPMQLKAFIKNVSKKKNVSPQLTLQNYFLERFLERVSVSPYRKNFVVKGGFLISSLVGLSARTTMDLDTTVKGVTLSRDSLASVVREIIALPMDDDIEFELTDLSEIRIGDAYPGIRIFLKALYPPINAPLTIDVTTGDMITPAEVAYRIPLMLEPRTIEVFGYAPETILAEKLQTIFARGTANTRLRDFYDVYILSRFNDKPYDADVLKTAFARTVAHRGTSAIFDSAESIFQTIRASDHLLGLWRVYSSEYAYARGISFEDVCDSVANVCRTIHLLKK